MSPSACGTSPAGRSSGGCRELWRLGDSPDGSLMRFRLVPADETFLTLFQQAAANAAECAERLRDVVQDLHAVEAGHARVIESEHRGDEITRTILRRLSGTFVTPFDREDIHELAEEIDDVVDEMLAVSHLLRLLRTHIPLPALRGEAGPPVQG